MTTTRTHRAAVASASFVAALALLAGCSSPAAPAPAGPISMPPADARGPVIDTDAEVAWTNRHPGCMTMSAAVAGVGNQVFRVTGPAAQRLREEAERGARPAGQHLRVRGYVDTAQDTAVCGPFRAFVLTEVVATV
ncbi:hypothetical protein BS329_15645 [Amycolatopsis coloradensis]|uniref:Uncharacterized protein n=1 Tax=Amycolatopsis coloradensis TaxID=76021 RepID=A0A1R0KU94_9PSEU|nr:hypothetical protein [Amycolatopsis coloradensis]OLZ51697.1 hypothetical protein BS329_15645 [Amycolatopsis coloradensis]